MSTCNCWVAHESEEIRFGIRFGAHALDCPTYRPSLDPVDEAEDNELRDRMEPFERSFACIGENHDVCAEQPAIRAHCACNCHPEPAPREAQLTLDGGAIASRATERDTRPMAQGDLFDHANDAQAMKDWKS